LEEVNGACCSTSPVSTSLSLIEWPSFERSRSVRKPIRAPDPSMFSGSVVLLYLEFVTVFSDGSIRFYGIAAYFMPHEGMVRCHLPHAK
jgi:hypothetical protein